MSRYRSKTMKYRGMFFFTFIACLLSFEVTSFISVRKASAVSEQLKERQTSQESVYTIQSSSFKDSQRAERQFRLIERSLEETALQALRIEKIGRYYTVRLGRFASLTEAEQFWREHELSLEGAIVMKAYFIDDRILLIHDGVEKDELEKNAGIKRGRNLSDIPYASNDLGLKLIGTALMDEPGTSIAIIENLASGDQELYKKGDTLNGVLIKRILSRGVIIDEGKGDKILFLVGGTNTRTLQSKSQRIQRREKVVDTTVSTYSAMVRGIKIRPYQQYGSPVGFAIYNIKPKSVFARVGLENCDVITAVNEKPVEVTKEPTHFYQTLRKGGEGTIDIKRDDINQKLSFKIN